MGLLTNPHATAEPQVTLKGGIILNYAAKFHE